MNDYFVTFSKKMYSCAHCGVWMKKDEARLLLHAGKEPYGMMVCGKCCDAALHHFKKQEEGQNNDRKRHV